MDDLDGIPRGGHEPDSLKALWKIIKKIVADISVLQRAAPQRSMSLTDGGDLTIKNGGKVTVEDQGEVTVNGEGRDWPAGNLINVAASLANRLADNVWIGFTYLVPGLYFTANGESRGATDPRVVSDSGRDVSAISAVEPLPYGPQVGPNIVSSGSFYADSWRAGVGAFAWDDTINPGGGDGVAGVRGAGSFSVTPYDINMLLTNHTPGPDGIPDGPAVWIHGSLEEGILHLYGRAGVDITGPFTVDGLPIGGAVTSVAGKTGAVTLVKDDVGLPNVDNTSDTAKPISTATQTALNAKAPTSHTHTTAQVTGLDTALAGKAPTSHTHTTAQIAGLDTALAGKASTAVATTTTDGLMPSTDKSKLDGSTPSHTAFRLMQRDSLGRAQVADPAVAADVATMGYVDGMRQKFKRVLGSSLPTTLTSAASWVSFGATVTVPADLFGPGVPYIVTAYAQAAGFPASGAVFSLRLLFSGSQPNGAKANSPNGPHNATTTVAYDFEVTTSASVTVSAQAQSVFGSSTIGTGADQAFYTVTAKPYTAL